MGKSVKGRKERLGEIKFTHSRGGRNHSNKLTYSCSRRGFKMITSFIT